MRVVLDDSEVCGGVIFDGQGHDDELHAGAGADALRGGAGDDRLWGGIDSDSLDGGPDNESLRLLLGFGLLGSAVFMLGGCRGLRSWRSW